MFVEAIVGDAFDLDYTPVEYRVKWATLPWEEDEAYTLRRAVFCIEQGVFVGDDRDEIVTVRIFGFDLGECRPDRAGQVAALDLMAGQAVALATVESELLAVGGARLGVGEPR